MSSNKSQQLESSFQKIDALQERRRAEKEARFAQEAEWLEAARGGDIQALEALLKSNADRLFAVAIGILKDPSEAEDAVQDSLLKAYRKLDTFSGESAFSTWIYRICFNTCLDYKRKHKRSRSHLVSDHTLSADLFQGGDRSDLKMAMPAGAQMKDPLQRIMEGELNTQFEAALEQLSEAHSAVIILREVEGLSYDEIAGALDINRGTVMSRLFHARKKLSVILRPYIKEVDSALSLVEGDHDE